MYQYIENCEKYYNYGYIESCVCAHSFVYNYDEIDLFHFIEFIEDSYPRYRIYMFLTKKCNYPISFLDKHFGLWNNLTRQKKIDVTCFEENTNNFKNYMEYYGFAKISDEQIYPAVNILCENPFNSFIILSQNDLFYDINYECFIKKNDNETEIAFSSLINSQTNSNIVITAIRGNDGLTLSLFEQP